MKNVMVVALVALLAGTFAFAEDESRPVQPLAPVQDEAQAKQEQAQEKKTEDKKAPRASHKRRSRKAPGFRFGIDEDGFRRIQEAIEGEIDRMKKRIFENGPLGEGLRGFRLDPERGLDDPQGLLEDITRQLEEMLGGEFNLDLGQRGRGLGGDVERRFFGETRVYKFENGKWTSEVHRFGDRGAKEIGETTTVVEPGEILGLRVAAVEEPLRVQLDLPRATGLLVEEVVPGSRADKAGFRAWDVIVEIGGQPVRVSDALDDRIQDAEAKATVIRRGQKTEFTVPAIEKK